MTPASAVLSQFELSPPYLIIHSIMESSVPLQMIDSMFVGNNELLYPFLAAIAP